MKLVREVREADMISELRRTDRGRTPILPVGCKVHAWGSTYKVYCVERPPAEVAVRFQDHLGPEFRTTEVPVIIPWQMYMVKTDPKGTVLDVRLYWMRGPLSGEQDHMLQFTMPNMYSLTGLGCMGGSYDPNGPDAGNTVDEKVRYVIDYVANSSFNGDLSNGNLKKHAPPAVKGMAIPDEVLGIPGQKVQSAILAVRYIVQLHLWCAEALNPRADVCDLPWTVVDTFENLLAGLLT